MTTATLDRTQFIGASEVSTIMGINPFCTPLQLWAYKTGRIVKEDQTECQEWGHRLERVVSEKFAAEHGVKLMAYKKRYVHPVMDFFSCELDNIIVGTDELVEIKTVNAHQWKQWENPDELPGYVICQVTAQMGLSKRKKAWVACLCGGQKYIEKCVDFDADLYHTIEQKVIEFWGFVQSDTPPAVVSGDNDFIVEIFPNNNDQLQLVEEMNVDIARRQELSAHIKELEAQKDEIEAKLKMVIGESLGIRTSSYLVNWKAQSRTSVDVEKLKADGLYDKYAKQATSRVLRITKNKE